VPNDDDNDDDDYTIRLQTLYHSQYFYLYIVALFS